ncbi:MAG TPA: ABC transporter permease subunit, partial [Terriglobia bacterium]|nr:ABC transporter permease subunit [Terriglobia bacterium]
CLWIPAGLAIFVVSWIVVGVDLHAIFSAQTTAAAFGFIRGLFPPDLSPAFLRIVLNATLQTIATAIAATILSILIGMPLAVLASANLWRRGILVEADKGSAAHSILSGASRIVRAALGFVRAVPDLLWAILFVTMFGLGALSGTLALAVAYSGLIGQVFSNVFDAADLQPLEGLQSTGASRLQIFLRGVLPQSWAPLTVYGLYSFECCVRAASVLGLVGAGGIGYEVGISMRLFEYGQVLTLMLAFIVLMAITDGISRVIRGRVTRRLTTPPDALTHPSLARKLVLPLSLFVGTVVSFYLAGFTPDVLDQQNLIQHGMRFISGMLPPDFGPAFLGKMAYLVLQTIAISVIGSAIGIVLGSLFAVPATAGIMFLDKDTTGHHSINERSLRFTVYWAARLVLNFLRAIPELLWVLVCILIIGIGPFAGAIAIGLHTAGVLGKLYAEVLEEVPRAPIEALRSVGANSFQVLIYAIWPQAKPMLFNYTLLRWEANLRVSTILGLVGGGGLGQAIYNNIQLGFYQQVATMILLVYGLVLASDWIGDRLRYADGSAL